jgi:hypothetical protein
MIHIGREAHVLYLWECCSPSVSTSLVNMLMADPIRWFLVRTLVVEVARVPDCVCVVCFSYQAVWVSCSMDLGVLLC